MPLMESPTSGAKIRMYRQGHGDCFLIAFRQDDGKPFYMLIDCGLKKGSEIHRKKNDKEEFHTIQEIATDIRDSTGGHLHLAVVTHEHEDHVSGFLRASDIFGKMKIDELWLAWTEDPNHDLANKLRRKYKDTLIGLVAMGQHLQAASSPRDISLKESIEELLGFETEDGVLPFGADAKKKIKGITNKKAIKLLRDRAAQNRGTRYLRPDEDPLTLPGVSGVRMFVLGPPENEALLKDLDPRGNEEFHLAASQGEERSLFAAVRHHASASGRTEPFGTTFRIGDNVENEVNQPFVSSYRIEPGHINSPQYRNFFERYENDPDTREDNTWRKIDKDWLRSGEQFALRMNSYVNNTSLVLAIELQQSRKVLLFVGDAQRGNWISWKDRKWDSSNGLEADEEIDSTDLLSRTVLYKVGHHGSHNATLNTGGLKQMAQGAFSSEFVAMIPAQEHWAKKIKSHPWQHPLDAIYKALYKKARGRVFQIDHNTIRKPGSRSNLISASEWNRFKKKVSQSTMYFEYTVEDS